VCVCVGVLQCVAVCCSAVYLPKSETWGNLGALLCSVLQCVAVHYSVLQYVTVCCSVLQCVAVCCSVLQSGSFSLDLSFRVSFSGG